MILSKTFIIGFLLTAAVNISFAESMKYCNYSSDGQNVNPGYDNSYHQDTPHYWIAFKPDIGIASFTGDIGYNFSFYDSGFTEFESISSKHPFSYRVNWNLGIEIRLSKMALDFNYSAFSKDFPFEKNYYHFGDGSIEFQSIDADWFLRSLTVNITRHFGDFYFGGGLSLYKEKTNHSITDSSAADIYDRSYTYSRDISGLNVLIGYNRMINGNLAFFAETGYSLVFDGDYSPAVSPPLGPNVSYYNDLDRFFVAAGLKAVLSLKKKSLTP